MLLLLLLLFRALLIGLYTHALATPDNTIEAKPSHQIPIHSDPFAGAGGCLLVWT